MITITRTSGSLAGTVVIRFLTTTPEERTEAERWVREADPEATKLALGHWNISSGAYEPLCRRVERYNTEQADPAGQKLLW